MATGIPSAHPPYKRMMDRPIADYIYPDHVPKIVGDEPFVLRKPGDMKVAHLDAWLNLLKDRQEKYLRREVDQIFRFVCTKAEPIPKPAVYDPDFMKAYALEHGPMYEPSSSQSAAPAPNPVNLVDESQASREVHANVSLAETGPPSQNGTSSSSSEAPSETRSSNSNESPFEDNGVGSLGYEEEDQQVDDYLTFEGDGTGDNGEREPGLSVISAAQNGEDGRHVHDAEVGEIVLLGTSSAN